MSQTRTNLPWLLTTHSVQTTRGFACVNCFWYHVMGLPWRSFLNLFMFYNRAPNDPIPGNTIVKMKSAA